MIVCGWCEHPTPEGDRCACCGHSDPLAPWTQRDQEPPTEAGWRQATARHRLADARRQLGPDATVDRLAEAIGVSPRTVRRWQQMTV